ncbi:hypothetical protein ACFL59_08740, partial [Planctomycetota bacterium]
GLDLSDGQLNKELAAPELNPSLYLDIVLEAFKKSFDEFAKKKSLQEEEKIIVEGAHEKVPFYAKVVLKGFEKAKGKKAMKSVGDWLVSGFTKATNLAANNWGMIDERIDSESEWDYADVCGVQTQAIVERTTVRLVDIRTGETSKSVLRLLAYLRVGFSETNCKAELEVPKGGGPPSTTTINGVRTKTTFKDDSQKILYCFRPGDYALKESLKVSGKERENLYMGACGMLLEYYENQKEEKKKKK